VTIPPLRVVEAAQQALAQVMQWPVENASAAVVTSAGAIATIGDTQRSYKLASVTKPLAALAILVACEEEALSLDMPADASLLPGATVEHLLSHASGVAPDGRLRLSSPGVSRVYSNTGFDLLGELLTEHTGIAFNDYFDAAIAQPLGLRSTTIAGSPARSGRSTVTDLTLVMTELLAPRRLLDPSTLAEATRVHFPGLRGVLPGFGVQQNNDWGLGFEIKDSKSPHWTATANSPMTYGHFGQSGTMLWIDPQAQVGLVALADRPFGEWAAQAWPHLGDDILAAFGVNEAS